VEALRRSAHGRMADDIGIQRLQADAEPGRERGEDSRAICRRRAHGASASMSRDYAVRARPPRSAHFAVAATLSMFFMNRDVLERRNSLSSKSIEREKRGI